jgi:hypothetical protein
MTLMFRAESRLFFHLTVTGNNTVVQMAVT